MIMSRFATVSEAESDVQAPCFEAVGGPVDSTEINQARSEAAARVLKRCPFLSDLERQFDLAVQDAGENSETLPTRHAACSALGLLWKAKQIVHSSMLPRNGTLYGDGEGGLRLEWVNGVRHLRLVIHWNSSVRDYLYHQEGNDYDVETDLSPANLGGWLRWLTGQMK